MNAIVPIIETILQLIASVVLPNLTDSASIAKVITTLEQIIPVIVQEAQDLVQPVKNIIAALQGNGAITADQLDQLAAQEAALDAAFDTAADAATKADASGT